MKAEKENTAWFPCKEKGKGKRVVSCISLIILTNNSNNGMLDFSASSEVRPKISSANPPGEGGGGGELQVQAGIKCMVRWRTPLVRYHIGDTRN